MDPYQETVAKWAGRGAEYVGGNVILRTSVSRPITLADIRRIFLNNPILPDSWAPEAESDLKLYCSTMVELNGVKSLRHFLPNHDGEYEFDEDRHQRYLVHKFPQNSNAPLGEPVTRHKIIHIEQVMEQVYDDNGNVVDTKFVDVEVDDGIIIQLKRVAGEKATDTTGDTKWGLDYFVGGQQVSGKDIPPRYLPFKRTLVHRFTEKCRRNYGTKEVRDIIMNLIRDHKLLGLQPIGVRGMYFCRPDQHDRLKAVAEGFRALDEGINIYSNELYLFADESENDSVRMTKDGVAEQLEAELAEFNRQLEELAQSDGTRPSTWQTRFEELNDLKKRIAKLQELRLISEKVLEKQIEKSLDLIKSGARASNR